MKQHKGTHTLVRHARAAARCVCGALLQRRGRTLLAVRKDRFLEASLLSQLIPINAPNTETQQGQQATALPVLDQGWAKLPAFPPTLAISKRVFLMN